MAWGRIGAGSGAGTSASEYKSNEEYKNAKIEMSSETESQTITVRGITTTRTQKKRVIIFPKTGRMVCNRQNSRTRKKNQRAEKTHRTDLVSRKGSMKKRRIYAACL